MLDDDLMTQSQHSIYEGSPTFHDLYEILRIPVLLALIAIAGTWTVWYFTSTSCSDSMASLTGCNPSTIARYISLDALNKIMTHAVIAGGGGGIWSYAMITRERRAREVAEKARLELERQLVEERERAAEERERAAEERERAAEEREKAAEEREKAAEERRQLLATIEHLTERLAEQQNGGSGQAGS